MTKYHKWRQREPPRFVKESIGYREFQQRLSSEFFILHISYLKKVRQTPTGIRDFKNNSYPFFLHHLERSFNSPELSYTNRRHGHKVSVRNILLLNPYYFPLVWSLHYSKYPSETVDKPPPWGPEWPEDSLSFVSSKEGPGILTFLYRLYQDKAIWSGVEVHWEKKNKWAFKY